MTKDTKAIEQAAWDETRDAISKFFVALDVMEKQLARWEFQKPPTSVKQYHSWLAQQHLTAGGSLTYKHSK